MPFFVGSGSASDGGLEMKSDRVGIPTGTSDPGSSVVGDVYVQLTIQGPEFQFCDSFATYFRENGRILYFATGRKRLKHNLFS